MNPGGAYTVQSEGEKSWTAGAQVRRSVLIRGPGFKWLILVKNQLLPFPLVLVIFISENLLIYTYQMPHEVT